MLNIDFTTERHKTGYIFHFLLIDNAISFASVKCCFANLMLLPKDVTLAERFLLKFKTEKSFSLAIQASPYNN